jgi:hypothetical protein
MQFKDLRHIEFVKSQLETAIDALQEIKDSDEYQALKDLIVEKTGGLELEDVLNHANRFSQGLDDLEAVALAEEETEDGNDINTDEDEEEREESLRYWAEGNSTDGNSK